MFEEYHDAFKKSNLCQNMDVEEYEAFLQKINPEIKSYTKKEYIIREGDPINFTAMVLRGEVLQKRDHVAGTQSVYTVLKKGQSFGEAIIMIPHRKLWPTDYIAKTDCTLLLFPRENIEKNITDPEVFTNHIFINWIYNVSVALERSVIAMRSLRNTSVRQKISTYFYEIYILTQKTQFVIPFNREELAAYLYMPQSSLSREMSNMKKDGIIDFHKSTVKILDLAALKENNPK